MVCCASVWFGLRRITLSKYLLNFALTSLASVECEERKEQHREAHGEQSRHEPVRVYQSRLRSVFGWMSPAYQYAGTQYLFTEAKLSLYTPMSQSGVPGSLIKVRMDE